MHEQIGLRCPRCGDVVYSNTRHDWEECICGGVFIDGGWEYQHVGFDGIDPSAIESVSRMVERKALPFYYSDEPDRKAFLIASSRSKS